MANEEIIKAAPKAAVDPGADPESDYAKMKKYFASQPKRTVRIMKDRGDAFVQVNGYTFIVQAGARVEVPEQVAQMLEEGGYI